MKKIANRKKLLSGVTVLMACLMLDTGLTGNPPAEKNGDVPGIVKESETKRPKPPTTPLDDDEPQTISTK